MIDILNQASTTLISYGIHPLLGGVALGFILALIVLGKRRDRGVSFDTRTVASSHSRPSMHGVSVSMRHPSISESPIGHASKHLTINGKTIPASSEDVEQLMQLVRGGKMIEAIKMVRALGHLDLKDAKDFVEMVSRESRR